MFLNLKKKEAEKKLADGQTFFILNFKNCELNFKRNMNKGDKKKSKNTTYIMILGGTN